MATVEEIVKEYFPDADEEAIEYIVWERTGFPVFWRDSDGNTPEECFRKQIRDFLDEVNMWQHYLEVECGFEHMPYDVEY